MTQPPNDENQTGQFGYEAMIEDGIRDIIAEGIANDPEGRDLGSMMRATGEFVDGFLQALKEKAPPPKEIACKSGCFFCCSGFEVQVTPLEALAIRDYLIENMDESQLSALLHGLMETAKEKDAFQDKISKGEFKPGDARPVFLCPLLSAGKCQVYDVRPLTCKGFNSYDASDCESVKTDPNSTKAIHGYIHSALVTDSAFRGVNEGAARRNLKVAVLDLVPALGIALSNVDAKERWLAGEDVFAGAEAVLVA